MDIHGRSEGERRLGPAFEGEFGDSMAARRWQVEWVTASSRRAFTPPFDVYETDQHIVIKVEIAGMREEGFAISLDGHMLRISGVRGDSGAKLAYQRMEINYGEFRLDIHLPYAVDEAGIEASYDQGFLIVCVPRQPQQRRVLITRTDAG